MSVAPRRLFSALLAFTFLVVAACATTPEARSGEVPRSPLFFWKVSQPGQPGIVYLLGTVHLREAAGANLDRALLERVDAADELVFEVVPDAAMNEAAAKAAKELGILPDGESLFDLVDDETRVTLEQVAGEVGLPVQALTRLRPWLAVLTFSVMRMQLQGYSEDAGTERLLLARASASGDRRTASLETVGEQLRLFADLPKDAQLEMLKELVNDIKAQDRTMETLQRAYESGDEAALSASVFRDRGESAESEALYRAMFDERNARMVARLAPWFAKDQETVVAVGVGHMLGAQGMPALFLQQGFQVEAVPALGLAPVLPKGTGPVGAFVDQGLGFSAEFHGKPQLVKQQVPTPEGGSAEIVVVAATARGLELAVVVNRVPTPIGGGELVAAAFDSMVAHMSEQFGPLERHERITMQGHPAMRFVAAGKGQRVEGLALMRGTQMYLLLASGAGNASGATANILAEATRFFASFQLLADEREDASASTEAASAPSG